MGEQARHQTESGGAYWVVDPCRAIEARTGAGCCTPARGACWWPLSAAARRALRCVERDLDERRLRVRVGFEQLACCEIWPVAGCLCALRGFVQDGAVGACDLGLVEGGVGGEQRFVVRLRARVEERAANADGGMNAAGAGGV
jgi:hypothetical protein